MKFFNVKLNFGFILLLLGSVACNMPQTGSRPDGKNSNGSNFVISSFSGSVTGSANVGQFALPGVRIYNFKACLIDYSRRSNIPNASFLIQEIDKTVLTDSQGCLNWAESIQFNCLSDSVWLKINRTLVAKGLQKGAQTATFAINPWSHGESLPDVLDLQKQSTPYLLENSDQVQKHLSGEGKTRQIWVENGSLNATDGKNTASGYSWQAQVFLNPQIPFTKTDSTPVLVPLANGVFKATISLISQDVIKGSVQRQSLAEQVIPQVEMKNNTLMINVHFTRKDFPTSGQAILGIKLEPIGAPAGLLPFEGIFPLGEAGAFTKSASLKVSEMVLQKNGVSQFSISQFVNEKALNSSATSSDQHMVKAGVNVANLQFSDWRIYKEAGQKKQMIYKVQACLTNSIGDEKLSFRDFEIEKFKSSASDKSVPLTRNSGSTSCVWWEEITPEFDRNECYHYIKGTVKIKNQDLGMNQEIEYNVNPWVNHAVDSKEMQQDPQVKYNYKCDSNNGKSGLNNVVFLDTLSLFKKDYKPTVTDRNLNLKIHAQYEFRLVAGIMDFSNEYTGMTNSQKPLPDGYYLLRLAFARSADHVSNNGYVGHADIIARSEGGIIKGDFEMDILDLKSTMARKTIVVELYPLDSSKIDLKTGKLVVQNAEDAIDKATSLISPSYSAGMVVLAQDTQSLNLKRISDVGNSVSEYLLKGISQRSQASHLIHDIIFSGEAEQIAQLKKNFDELNGQDWAAWAKKQNIELHWLNNQSSVSWLKNTLNLTASPEAELESLVNMKTLNSSWALKFCSAFARGALKNILKADAAALEWNCAKELFQKTEVYRVLHLSGPGQLIPTPLSNSSITVSNSFGFTTEHTKMVGTESKAGINLHEAFRGFGFGVGLDLIKIETDDTSSHNSTDITEGTILNKTKYQFNLPIDSYQKCTLIRMNPRAFVYESNNVWYKPWKWEMNKLNLRGLFNLEGQLNISDSPLLHGWLICSGQQSSKQNIQLNESYYFISQETINSESFDSANEINRNFFLPIRGVSDMHRFKALFCNSKKQPGSAHGTTQAVSDVLSDVNPIFNRMDPAPGMIMVDPIFDDGITGE